MLMKVRIEPVNFELVEPKHEAMHKRLENWAAWCKGAGLVRASSPMFRLYRPDNFERLPVRDQVDGTDAQRIAKAMHKMALKHRASLNWFYVKPVAPLKFCKLVGLTMEGLAEHVTEGRQMLINLRA